MCGAFYGRGLIPSNQPSKQLAKGSDGGGVVIVYRLVGYPVRVSGRVDFSALLGCACVRGWW